MGVRCYCAFDLDCVLIRCWGSYLVCTYREEPPKNCLSMLASLKILSLQLNWL